MILKAFFVAGALVLAAALPAHADLTGTTVNGTLSFNGSGQFFNPSSAVIGPGVEFTFNDGLNMDTANFTGSSLTITDFCEDRGCHSNSLFKMTFTDPAFLGLSTVSNALGLTASISGDVLTFTFPGGFPATGPATFDSVYSITSAATTPEPSSLMLLGTGVLGMAGLVRKRFLRS